MHLCTVTPPHADVSLDDLDHICDPASL
jgi:hypothetical protein